MENKLRSPEYKKGPRTFNYDVLGHTIKRILRIPHEKLWWCDTCAGYVYRHRTAIVPRHKKEQ